MNEIFMLCILIIGIISLYLANKILDTFGVKLTFIVFNLLTFITSFKYLTLSTLHFNANVFNYCIMYTAICLLFERSTKNEVNSIINLNLIISITSALLLYITSYYTQSINDSIAINMTNVFTNHYKLLIIYPISTYISLKLLVYIYYNVKGLYENIFISMVSSYLAIGLINLIIYHFAGYYKILKIQTIIKILLSTYMVNIIIIIIYSIIITLIQSKKVKKW